METNAVYHWLMAGQTAAADGESFDRHCLASILSLAFAENPRNPLAAAGLDGSSLMALGCLFFRHALPVWAELAPLPAPERSEDELCLLDLLGRGSSARTPLQYYLAALIARRAQRPNHLWQDLGLRHRGDLSQLMERHFAPIARKNRQDMKWKKFLYRAICRDEGYGFCAAPSCAECDDFALCFGDESGDALLAHVRRSGDLAQKGTFAV